ncbi:MAG: hypothetical protein O7B35_19755 [Deltaproteobacteria bacterium]|nr:hypothetical protein [Deltaproteobacteria bacterium]
MPANSFEEKCKDAIAVLFDAATLTAGKDGVCSALRHVVRLNKSIPEKADGTRIDYYLGPATLHNFTNLFHYIDSAESQHRQRQRHIVVMLKLFSYVQCVENRYTYKALGNLLRVILKKAPDGELYDSFSSGAQCFNDVSELAKRVSGATMLLELWQEFIDFKLRNAVSHGDYVIRNDSSKVFIPSATLDLITGHITAATEQKAAPAIYSFHKIDDLYKKANSFQAAFKLHVQQFGIAIGPRY